MGFTCPRLSIDEDGGVLTIDSLIYEKDGGLKNFLLICLFTEDFSELDDLEISYFAFHTDKIVAYIVAFFLSFMH